MSTAREEGRALWGVRVQSGSFLLLAIWFGLLVGLAEVSVRAVQKFFLHQMIWLRPHVVWMGPLAEVFSLAIPGFILFLVARRWPRFASLRVAVFIFVFLGFLGPLLWVSRLHPYAVLLLVAGLATQTARFIAVHSSGFHALVPVPTDGW